MGGVKAGEVGIQGVPIGVLRDWWGSGWFDSKGAILGLDKRERTSQQWRWLSVAFSALARIFGECSTIHSPPALFFFF